MSIGVGITTDYADENYVVFHGYFGLFVYDLQQSRMALALDPGTAFGTNNMQGSSGYMVSAYKDGDAVKVIATFYDSMQGMLSPVSYYYDTAAGLRSRRLRFRTALRQRLLRTRLRLQTRSQI